MCGIFGIVSSSDQGDACDRLLSAFAHRGPDSSGLWRGSEVTFGHTRLAILDLSNAGHQPMVSHSGNLVISYNGEIYNYSKLRDELQKTQDASFRGTSDTEVLITAIESWGLEKTLSRIQGIFAFAVWNFRTRELSLVRDRMGVKPLMFGWLNRTFFFASDSRILHYLDNTQLHVSETGVNRYFRYGFIPAPYTIYDRVWKLPPASYVRVTREKLAEYSSYGELCSSGSIRRYWTRSYEKRNLPAEDDPSLRLEQVLATAVKAQLASDVSLGAFLSGGIDSSTVVSLMARHADRRVQTFSIGFSEDRYDESSCARAVAEHLGTEHHELICTASHAVSAISDIASIYDEPFGDSSALPTAILSRLTRSHVKVSLSGDGGDELFGGYPRYGFSEQFLRLSRFVPSVIRHITANCIRRFGVERWQRFFERFPCLVPHHVPLDSAGSSAMTVARLLEMEQLGEIYEYLISQWPKLFIENQLGSKPEIGEFSRPDLPVFEQLTECDFNSYLPDDILAKVDRASMWYGLEARVPLLDEQVVAYVFSLPTKVRYADRGSKKLLRSILSRHLPQHLVDRKKQGFGAPVEIWLRKELRDWAESLLPMADELCRRYLPAIDIRNSWKGFQSENGRWNPGLWSALMLAAWHERWMTTHGASWDSAAIRGNL